MEIVNWNYSGAIIKSIEDLPEGCIGFIYQINNKTNGKFYIGKKNLLSITNPTVSKKKYDEIKAEGGDVVKTKDKSKSTKDRVVWRYKAKSRKTETDWLTYNGSNKELNSDIARGHKVEKIIHKLCFTKSELTLAEAESLFVNKVLYKCESYNGNILAKFFKQVEC